MSSVEDFAAAQHAEYSTYVATVPILHGGARAYNPGDPVPISNVEAYDYLQQGFVREVEDPDPAAAAPDPATAPAVPAYSAPPAPFIPASAAPVAADTTPNNAEKG